MVLGAHRHRVDHGGTVRTVEHDQFQKVPRLVRTENQIPGWVLGDLLDDDGVTNDIKDVLGGHSMTNADRRTSTKESYYETVRVRDP